MPRGGASQWNSGWGKGKLGSALALRCWWPGKPRCGKRREDNAEAQSARRNAEKVGGDVRVPPMEGQGGRAEARRLQKRCAIVGVILRVVGRGISGETKHESGGEGCERRRG